MGLRDTGITRSADKLSVESLNKGEENTDDEAIIS